MVLYSVHTNISYLPNIIIHRMTVNKCCDAAILVWEEEAEPYRSILGKLGFEIIEAPLQVIGRTLKNSEAIKSSICTFFDNLLLNNGYRLDSFNEIVSTIDNECEFHVYLGIRQKHYYVMEYWYNHWVESKSRLANWNKKAFPEYHKICQQLGAYFPDGMNSTPIVLSTSTDSKGLFSNYVEWDINAVMSGMTESMKTQIIDAYNFRTPPPNERDESFCLVRRHDNRVRIHMKNKGEYISILYGYILNNFATRKQLSEQILLDYLVPNLLTKVYLKNHGCERFYSDAYIQTLFGENTISFGLLPGSFYQLLPESEKYNFTHTITFGSSVDSLSTYNTSILAVTGNFWRTWWSYNAIFSLIEMAAEKMQGVPLYCDEFIIEQVACLLKTYHAEKSIDVRILDKQSQLPEKGFVIVDDSYTAKDGWSSKINKAKEDVVCCFLNYRYEYHFWNDRYYRDFIPYVIKKEKIKSEIDVPLNNECFFVITKSTELRKQLRNFYIQKSLPRTGIRITVSNANFEEQFAIIMDIRRKKQIEQLENRVLELEKHVNYDSE